MLRTLGTLIGSLILYSSHVNADPLLDGLLGTDQISNKKQVRVLERNFHHFKGDRLQKAYMALLLANQPQRWLVQPEYIYCEFVLNSKLERPNEQRLLLLEKIASSYFKNGRLKSAQSFFEKYIEIKRKDKLDDKFAYHSLQYAWVLAGLSKEILSAKVLESLLIDLDKKTFLLDQISMDYGRFYAESIANNKIAINSNFTQYEDKIAQGLVTGLKRYQYKKHRLLLDRIQNTPYFNKVFKLLIKSLPDNCEIVWWAKKGAPEENSDLLKDRLFACSDQELKNINSIYFHPLSDVLAQLDLKGRQRWITAQLHFKTQQEIKACQQVQTGAMEEINDTADDQAFRFLTRIAFQKCNKAPGFADFVTDLLMSPQNKDNLNQSDEMRSFWLALASQFKQSNLILRVAQKDKNYFKDHPLTKNLLILEFKKDQGYEFSDLVTVPVNNELFNWISKKVIAVKTPSQYRLQLLQNWIPFNRYWQLHHWMLWTKNAYNFGAKNKIDLSLLLQRGLKFQNDESTLRAIAQLAIASEDWDLIESRWTLFESILGKNKHFAQSFISYSLETESQRILSYCKGSTHKLSQFLCTYAEFSTGKFNEEQFISRTKNNTYAVQYHASLKSIQKLNTFFYGSVKPRKTVNLKDIEEYMNIFQKLNVTKVTPLLKERIQILTRSIANELSEKVVNGQFAEKEMQERDIAAKLIRQWRF